MPSSASSTERSPAAAVAFPQGRGARKSILALGWLLLCAVCVALIPDAASAQGLPGGIPGRPSIPGFAAPGARAVAPMDSDDVLAVRALPASSVVAPGGDVAIAVEFTLAPGWHIWPIEGSASVDTSDFTPIWTELVSPTPPAGVDLNLAFAQWPATKSGTMDFGTGPIELPYHEGPFVVYIPATVRADAPEGALTIPLRVEFQACDDTTCKAPDSIEVAVTLTVGREGGATKSLTDGTKAAPADLLAGFDPSVYGRIRSGEKPSERLEFNLFALKFSIDPTGAGFALLLLIAAAGGLLLNFTPCVLPVIPIKIIGLSQAAQGSRAKCFALGFVMSLGVVAFWLALGTLMATVKGFTSANQLFQQPLFTIGVGVVIAVMAIGMAGLFSLRLPDWVYMVEAKHDSYPGSFGFGVMTAVLSTPCTAPLMGTAVAWATTQGPATILTVFGAVGAGMAVPYLVLSAFPSLVDKMPRTGPASDLIKQVMGLLLLAAAAYFIGAGLSGLLVTPPEPPNTAYWWAVALLGAAAGGWLLVRTVALTRKPVNRVVFGGLGAFILAISVLIGLSQTAKGPIDWTYYTPERLATARSEGKVVVIDFTAEWCANCKTLEALVLNLPSVAKELNADDVAAIKVDLTGNNTDGNKLLKDSNRATIPLLLVYDRDGREILNASDYTPQQVIDAINAARAAGAIGAARGR